MAPVRSMKIRPLTAGESRGVCDIVPDDVLVAVDCVVPVCLSTILHLSLSNRCLKDKTEDSGNCS
jgi:hypothetical protein